MAPSVYRFTFPPAVPIDAVEDSLTLSVVGVESLFGDLAARVGAGHLFDPARRTCVIRGGGRAGQGLVKLFTGYITRGLGPDAYRVERVDEWADPAGGR